MKRVIQAPNLAMATLWADMLAGVGIPASVQRAYASGIAGEIPPDQSLPEVWVRHDEQQAQARELLHQWQHAPHRRWACPGCHEIIDGPFEQCWKCGQMQPA